MTQRVDLANVMDRLAVDDLATGHAAAVDDADRDAYRRLFTAFAARRTPDGRRLRSVVVEERWRRHR